MSQEITEKEHKSKKGDTKIGAVIILVISAIVFIPAGGAAVFQSIFGKNKIPTFGSYNGKKITYEQNSDFNKAAANLTRTYQNMGYDVNQQMYYYIFNQAFEQTVYNMAFNAAVKKSGYTAQEKTVNREVVKYFTDANGNFSQKAYNQADEAEVRSLKADIRNSLTYQRYVEDVFGTNGTQMEGKSLYGVKSNPKEEAFIADMEKAKSSFKVAAFSFADFPKSQAAVYGKDNAEKFLKYDLSVLTVETEKEAKAVAKQIKDGSISFEDACKEKSLSYYADSEGKAASPYRYQILDMLENEDDIAVVSALSKDELSSVIKTKRGYSIFRNDGDNVAANMNNESVLDVVVSYLNANEKSYIENYYTEQAKNFTQEAAVNGLDRTAKKYGITLEDAAAFPVNYGNNSLLKETASSGALMNLSTNKEALKAMFALNNGDFTAPLVMGEKIVVAYCEGKQIDNAADTADMADTIKSQDQSSVMNAVMTSDKVENNFMATYFEYFMNN